LLPATCVPNCLVFFRHETAGLEMQTGASSVLCFAGLVFVVD
jgi:hypothetical protein